MSPAPNDLFFAVTTNDGSVYHTTRQAGGTWAAFNKVSNLAQTGRRNVSVAVTQDQQICAINDAAVRQLRYTKDLTGATPAVLVRTGVAPVSAESAGGSLSMALLGIGARTVAGWSFGLPLLLIKDDQTVAAAGDELANFDTGVFNPADPGVALDIAGTFDDTTRSYHILLATASGDLYHGFRAGAGRGRFDAKVAFGVVQPIISVSCSLGHEGLHACWVDQPGRIFHAIRATDGIWSPVNSVSDLAGAGTETFKSVAVSHFNLPGRGGVLHLAGVTQSGGILYANRSAEDTADPLWSTFLDVKSQAGDKGPVTTAAIAAQP